MQQHSDTVTSPHPILGDLVSCDRWLERERITDSDRACAVFIDLLAQLENAPPSAATYAQILERLRTPIHLALEDQSRRFAGKPLPFAPAEAAAFARSRDLWLSQILAWRRLLRSAMTRPDLAGDRPRLTLRTLESIAGLIAARLSARHNISPEHWQWLHEGYELAEKDDIAELDIPGEHGSGTLTCSAIYTQILLLQMANPAALSQREFEWAKRWASRWTGKVRLSRTPEHSGGLAVDVAGGAGPAWTAAETPAATLRFIDCALVRRSIRSRIAKLDEGSAPVALGLGKDCPPFAAKELLNTLLHCWNNAPRNRQFPRHHSSGSTELIANFAGIHKAISGNAFKNENSAWDHTLEQNEQVHRIHPDALAMAVQMPGGAIERWETLDESANGFRLRRGVAGTRLAHRQLVALRPQGVSHFMLCDVRWLCVSDDGRTDAAHAAAENANAANGNNKGSFCMGAKAMPGLPQACALRTGTGDSGAWTQAFVLPLTAGLAPNLVLPIGWYQAGRELDLKLQNEDFRIRLDDMLERGHDYQRVSFSAIGKS